MYTLESTIGEVLSNPLGADLIEIFRNELKLNRLLIYNGLSRKIKLKTLHKLSRGELSIDFLEMIVSKLNHFRTLELPDHSEEIKPLWWKESVAYQIYPRSFKDSNGDGIGDLGGIIEKLDYLKELGIDLIWLSPVYDSPNDDNGYDIRDYKKIMAEFGTMDDFDSLLSACHQRGMRLIMDLVINHTSDEHQWYVESSRGKDNPYRPYYIWKEGREDEPPNNWTSLFSGPAWNYDKKSGEWSMHIWSKKQMDLNWDHEPLRQDIYKMVNWWLDKGIDGFRLDVINFISKDEGYPDGDPTIAEMMGVCGVEHYAFGKNVHKYLQELHKETFSKYDIVTVGETPGLGLYSSQFFTHEKRKELDLIFNFDHIDNPGNDRFDDYCFDLNILKNQMLFWQQKYGNSCWNSLFLENHDYPRMISKINNDPSVRNPLAKMLAALILTMKGTPFIYQGQEMAMVNVNFESIDDYRDVESLNLYKKLLVDGMSPESALAKVKCGSRDHSRTPMQWTSGKNAGFSSGKPWLDPSMDSMENNIEIQMADNESVFHFYRDLIALRKKYKTLVYGDFLSLRSSRKDMFSYYRKDRDESFYIEMNLSAKMKNRNKKMSENKLLLSSYRNFNPRHLAPYEVNIFKL
ncbi:MULTISPECIES: alpha-glucosidase [unclassified Oceanispirochaeta]|uniref:alpha-glucosidase n=1 Tax=unclassified Oceanispirochaeta TaxID=2635722 RepID=UPI0018F3DF7D|nr:MULTISPECIES: alpha-glucosidase [unclassified Oceanispirochaeta]